MLIKKILILIFLSMVHEYAYFFMNTFGKWSIGISHMLSFLQ